MLAFLQFEKLITFLQFSISSLFFRLNSCTLLTRQSASVLKVGVPCGLRAYNTRLAYSVTVRISA